MTDDADGTSTDGDDRPTRDDDHLAGVDPGAGCTEIWEHLSEHRHGDGSDEE